jgi:hypothetical protein
MPKANTVETYYANGKWNNKVGTNAEPSNSFDTKAEAVAKGREMADELGYEHVIKNKDGTIGDKDSHGNDPYPPKG